MPPTGSGTPSCATTPSGWIISAVSAAARSSFRKRSSCKPPTSIPLGGADGFLRHLAADPAQALDARIVDGLRNFLADPPAGMDLAAINIQRGHDLGLGTLNETREALHLTPYTSFEQLTSDPGTLAGAEGHLQRSISIRSISGPAGLPRTTCLAR